MEDSHFEGISSLVRLSGANVPSRARFVGEAVLSGTLSALTLGLVCGQVGAALTVSGPLVPFLVGSWTGYTVGLWRYWDTCTQMARAYAKRYPTILAHALRIERGVIVPTSVLDASMELNAQSETDAADFKNTNITSSSSTSGVVYRPMTMEQWVVDGGLGRLSWSVLAAQSCRSDIEEIERQARQRIMDEYGNNDRSEE